MLALFCCKKLWTNFNSYKAHLIYLLSSKDYPCTVMYSNIFVHPYKLYTLLLCTLYLCHNTVQFRGVPLYSTLFYRFHFEVKTRPTFQEYTCTCMTDLLKSVCLIFIMHYGHQVSIRITCTYDIMIIILVYWDYSFAKVSFMHYTVLVKC